ncbi:MAG TPA: hypothetical protein VGB37_16270 [Candidatus Lokiarchaeia archaeon]|jgi:hypothetical protein
MTKTEILLQDKINKDDCKEKHDSLEKLIEVKIKSLERIIVEKLKSVTWFSWVHLGGYVSIIATLIAIFIKLK